MRKKKLIHNIEEAKIKILNYFNENKENGKLRILDKINDISKVNSYTYKVHNIRKYYTGVSFDYIRLNIFNNKISKSLLSYVLMELLKDCEIKSLYCGDIHKIIFENNRSSHSTNYFIDYNRNDNDYHKGYNIESIDFNRKFKYDKYVKYYYIIHSQINKSNKIENADSRFSVSV